MQIKRSTLLIRFIAFSFFTFILYVFLAATFKWNNEIFSWMKGIPYFDKIMHFFLIGGFAFFMNLLLRNKRIPFLK